MKRSDKLAAGKLDVDVPLVTGLIARQFPHWSGLPVTSVAQDGWDNWTFRLGDTMKVRLPSAEGYAAQTEKEARWLPQLAPHLPLTIPAPVGVGRPDLGYPWAWSIYEWIEGEPTAADTVADMSAFARDLAGFLRALQAVDAAGGPSPGSHNFYRGAPPIPVYGDEARRAIAALGDKVDAAAAHALLDAASKTDWPGEPVWVHGDIAAGNLLVRDGRLSAVIDFGSSAVGDPACDLVIAWVFFSGAARAAFREAIGASDATWARARAWALWKAALVASSGAASNPAEIAPLKVIEAVLAEHAGR